MTSQGHNELTNFISGPVVDVNETDLDSMSDDESDDTIGQDTKFIDNNTEVSAATTKVHSGEAPKAITL